MSWYMTTSLPPASQHRSVLFGDEAPNLLLTFMTEHLRMDIYNNEFFTTDQQWSILLQEEIRDHMERFREHYRLNGGMRT